MVESNLNLRFHSQNKFIPDSIIAITPGGKEGMFHYVIGKETGN